MKMIDDTPWDGIDFVMDLGTPTERCFTANKAMRLKNRTICAILNLLLYGDK